MSADNYLPEMEMPSEPEEPETEPEVSFDPLVSVAGDDEGSITMDVQDEDEEVEDEEVEVEEEPVPIKEKKKLSNDEVFNTPQVMAVQDPEKPVKKKRVATEKQLAALKKARETNRLKREAKLKMKNEGKELPTELLSKKKQKQKAEVKKEIRSQQIMFSEDQVAKITADAIDKYEAKRKVRKIEKNKIKEAEEHENKNRQTLQRAMKQPDHSDPWGMVLSGLI
tara:strand:+ start:490 stop:1161 length:672 start_codon:yes stop_codon:yes gene_type:complete